MPTDPEFWVLVGFVILVVAIFRPVKRALLGGLDARTARIKLELEEARQLREEAAQLVEQYRKKQREALAEAEAIVKRAAEDAMRTQRNAEAELANALARREQQAKERIAQAEATAIAEVRALAVDLAIAVTRKLVAENLDAARAAALVDDSIAELPRRLN